MRGEENRVHLHGLANRADSPICEPQSETDVKPDVGTASHQFIHLKHVQTQAFRVATLTTAIKYQKRFAEGYILQRADIGSPGL